MSVGTYAQSRPVVFRPNGSIVVSNQVVHLQTTTPLNVGLLYQPSINDALDGIEMITAPQLGANPRVEVRVFDYDDVNKKKGNLIYATEGTRFGLNHNSWNAAVTLFPTAATFPSGVSNLFRGQAIPSTDIKTWSQFESLGTVCADRYDTRQRCYRNIVIHPVDYEGKSAVSVRDDDDFECSKQPEEIAGEKEEKAAKSQAAVTTAATLVEQTDAELRRLTLIYDARATEADAAMDRAILAQAAAHRAHAASQALEVAYSALAAQSAEAQATALSLTNSQIAEAQARAVAAQAFDNFRQAFRQEAALENEAFERRKQFDEAQTAILNAQNNYSEKSEALKEVRNHTLELAKALARNTDNLKSIDAKVLAMGQKLSLAQTDAEQNVIASQLAELMELQTEAAQRNRDLVHLMNANELMEQLLLMELNEIDESGRAASDYFAATKAAYNTATINHNNFASVIGRQRDEVKAADENVEMAARAAFNAAIIARIAEKNVDDARRNYENVRNSLPSSSDALGKQTEADKAFEEMRAAQQAAQVALEALNKARAARAKASAELLNTYQRYDDDDDEAGAAAATAAAFENVNNLAFGDLGIVAYTDAFGSPYLFNDRIDDELFHNPTITRHGIDRLAAMLKQCSSGAWCNAPSPMPVVLVEVVVRNAELKSIKIPGLPLLLPDHLQSVSPVYTSENSDTLVDITAPGATLMTAGNYQIDNAPFATQIQLTDFPKYDHITVPDLNDTTPKEIRMDNWGRVPLVGTGERLSALQEQLNQTARAAGVEPDVYFSLRHISHNFMNVTAHPGHSYIDPLFTYELWSLTINTQYANAFTTLVTPEGPFKASHGFMPASALQKMGGEILMRHTGDQVGPTKQDETFTEEEPTVIYPNPSDGEFAIRFNQSERTSAIVRVYNAVGRQVFEQTEIIEPGTHVTTISLKGQPSALYTVLISTRRGVLLRKVVLN